MYLQLDDVLKDESDQESELIKNSADVGASPRQ